MAVLIVEDEPKVSAFIQKGLLEYGFESEVIGDGNLALQRLQNGAFDLVLLDINLPGKNGIDVCSELRSFNNTVPVLMLTALGATDDKVSGFDAGADDYLVKPFEFIELIARVKALLKRSNLEQNASIILKVHDLEMDLVKKRVSRAGKNIELTAKEFALLEFMLKNKGRVLSKSEIASKVWDINFDTGTNVIEVYVNFLRKKIDKDYAEKLIQTKVGMGYVLKDD
jgi:two-component system copper resistance phosphate regulon response regulator CusR